MNTQKTIGNMEEIVGKGLHLGDIARVQLFPLPADSGIKLFYKNSNVKIEPQRIDAKAHTDLATI